MTRRARGDRRALEMSNPITPNKSRRGKWIALALLVALAAFMYASIMLKVMKYGF